MLLRIKKNVSDSRKVNTSPIITSKAASVERDRIDKPFIPPTELNFSEKALCKLFKAMSSAAD